MSHPRIDIRLKVAELLTDATGAGDRVYPSRAFGLEQAMLPALAVYDDGEDVQDPESDRPRRTLTLLVELHNHGKDAKALDDGLDELAWQVEIALDANPRLNGLAIGTQYQGMKKARDADGNTIVGVLIMEYAVEYTVELPEPTLPPFSVFDNELPNYAGTGDRVELEQDE